MAKDPAFLFYYDRFLSGTFTMTDEQVGQYIRLMCIQANKGYISKKDMLHICKTSDNEVILKFTEISPHKFANLTLMEIMGQRKSFTESRRTNRMGKKATSEKQVNNICETSEQLMVNVTLNKDINRKDGGTGVRETHSTPEIETVQRTFLEQGGTIEQANKFFADYEAINWKKKGEPIKNFIFLVPAFIQNWKNFNNGISKNQQPITDPGKYGGKREHP